MARRQTYKMKKTNNPYAPLTFKRNKKEFFFVPKGGRNKTRLLDMETGMSKIIKFFKLK